jgi:hypothetical protein
MAGGTHSGLTFHTVIGGIAYDKLRTLALRHVSRS